MTAAELHREVIRLLVQIAWADRDIDASEQEHILDIARGAELADNELEDVKRALQDECVLPAPNIELLKRYRQDVIRAVRVLIARDGKFTSDEAVMLEQITKMLEG